jgi:hypothetical protein
MPELGLRLLASHRLPHRQHLNKEMSVSEHVRRSNARHYHKAAKVEVEVEESQVT